MDDITRKLIEAAEAAIPCDPDDGTLPVFTPDVDEHGSRIDFWTPVEGVARAAVAAVLRELAKAGALPDGYELADGIEDPL